MIGLLNMSYTESLNTWQAFRRSELSRHHLTWLDQHSSHYGSQRRFRNCGKCMRGYSLRLWIATRVVPRIQLMWKSFVNLVLTKRGSFATWGATLRLEH